MPGWPRFCDRSQSPRALVGLAKPQRPADVSAFAKAITAGDLALLLIALRARLDGHQARALQKDVLAIVRRRTRGALTRFQQDTARPESAAAAFLNASAGLLAVS
jgi:hypothetical protein